jgi:hypothetical protein
MYGSHCRHDEFDWETGRCWNCGIRRNHTLSHGKVAPRNFTTRHYPHPFNKLQFDIVIRKENNLYVTKKKNQ